MTTEITPWIKLADHPCATASCIDPDAWQIVDGALLCRTCAAERVCSAKGHNLLTRPTYTYCSRCDHVERVTA